MTEADDTFIKTKIAHAYKAFHEFNNKTADALSFDTHEFVRKAKPVSDLFLEYKEVFGEDRLMSGELGPLVEGYNQVIALYQQAVLEKMNLDTGLFTYEGEEYAAFDMPAAEVWQIAENLGWSNPLEDEDMDEIGGHRIDEAIWDAVEWIRDNS